MFLEKKQYVLPKRRNKSTLRRAQTQKVYHHFKPQHDGGIETKNNPQR